MAARATTGMTGRAEPDLYLNLAKSCMIGAHNDDELSKDIDTRYDTRNRKPPRDPLSLYTIYSRPSQNSDSSGRYGVQERSIYVCPA